MAWGGCAWGSGRPEPTPAAGLVVSWTKGWTVALPSTGTGKTRKDGFGGRVGGVCFFPGLNLGCL